MAFDRGHKLLKFFMRWMQRAYKPNERSVIGPNGLSKAFQMLCNHPSKIISDSVYDFKCDDNVRVTKRPSIPSRISNRIDFMNKISTRMNWTLLIKVIRFTFTDRDTGLTFQKPVYSLLWPINFVRPLILTIYRDFIHFEI